MVQTAAQGSMQNESQPETKHVVAEPPSAVLTLLVTVLQAALLVVTIGGLPQQIGGLAVLVMRLLAAMLFAILLIWYTRRRYYLPQTTSHRKTRVWQLPDRQVNILQRSAGRSGGLLSPQIAGSAQAQAFTFSILRPSHVRQRITERYDPTQRTLKQEVSIDAQVPQRLVAQLLKNGSCDTPPNTEERPASLAGSTAGQAVPHTDEAHEKVHLADQRGDLHKPKSAEAPVILFPVLVPRKGAMVDNLRVMAADGSSLPVLSYRQYLQLVARVLRTLLDIAHGGDIEKSTHPNAFASEHTALRAISLRADGNIEDKSGSQALMELETDERTSERITNPAARNLAADLTAKLTSHYAIVAAIPCPTDGRFCISYERLITPALGLTSRPHWILDRNEGSDPRFSGTLRWAKARLRLLFGARPVDVSIALDNAWTTQSYHLFMDGQEGVFVGVQEAPGLEDYLDAHWKYVEASQEALFQARVRQQTTTGRPATTEIPEPPPPPYFRFRRRAGQRYAHFYTRFFPEPSAKVAGGDNVPTVRFRFYEVPPGSVFRAVITAIASALLIWLIGFVISRKPDPGTDVPAFLLVFPAVAAAWLGFEGSSRRLLEGTLAARLSLLMTVLLSIGASGLFMIYKANLPFFHWHNPYHMRVLGIRSLGWTSLTLAAILNAVAIGYVYLARTWEFIHLSGRYDNFEKSVENG